MKKSLDIYWVAILLVLFVSCNEQVRTGPQSKNNDSKENLLLESIYPIQKIDTIWTNNAPSGITRKIRKDNNGNLLFAAYEDIVRHDGVSFTKRKKELGLDSYDAFDVWEDRKGGLWITSTLKGVFHYPASDLLRNDEKAYRHFTTENGLAHNRTMCIYEDRAGGIWIGTENGISYFKEEDTIGKKLALRNFTEKNGLANSNVNTIMEDKSGKIWVGTRGNLFMHDPRLEPKPEEVSFTEFKNGDGSPFKNIWSIVEDKRGHIWLAGEYGLWVYDGNLFTNLSTINVLSVYEDKKGNVWFTHQDGFSYYEQKSLLGKDLKATQVFKGGSMYFEITEDKNGDIWIGYLDGVLRYDGKSVVYFGNMQSKAEKQLPSFGKYK